MSSIKFEFRDGTTVSFGVTKFPDRKRAALYKMRVANIDVLAYFRNDGCAEEFQRLLDVVIEKANANVKLTDGGQETQPEK
jgi:hypothetical protein